MKEPVLVTENLEKRYGDVVAASEISIAFYPDETGTCRIKSRITYLQPYKKYNDESPV